MAYQRIPIAEREARKAASALRRAAARKAYRIAHAAQASARDKQRLAARKASATPDRTCGQCGAGFSSIGRHAQRDALRFCSRACGFAHQAAVRALDKALRLAATAGARERAQTVKAERKALQRIARHVEKPRTFTVACRTCASPIVARRNGGLHKVTCDMCRADTERMGRRVDRARRRARERGAGSERIDPLAVFAQAGWHCQCCGKETPRRLRGTIDPAAPELDHIRSLAKGGSHTRDNVQLLCRFCNQCKSDNY